MFVALAYFLVEFNWSCANAANKLRALSQLCMYCETLRIALRLAATFDEVFTD
jgi:hypothetical protein